MIVRTVEEDMFPRKKIMLYICMPYEHFKWLSIVFPYICRDFFHRIFIFG